MATPRRMNKLLLTLWVSIWGVEGSRWTRTSQGTTMFITDWAGGFQDANAACAREAGDSESHVVAFRSQLEWDSWMDASMLAAVRRSWVWLSYTDASIEGDWVGGDGYPMPSFAEWDVGEPDDLFNEDCSHLWAIRGYLAINDIGCYGVLPALCRTGKCSRCGGFLQSALATHTHPPSTLNPPPTPSTRSRPRPPTHQIIHPHTASKRVHSC